jgi:2-isopropylmalate synthase
MRDGQPPWNPQRGTAMPSYRYTRSPVRVPGPAANRLWPDGALDHAPLWCSVDLRDGNQSLVSPMDARRKSAMFDLLVTMGFKEIEVGYPAASETDFSFVQELIRQDRIPGDVSIVVFTPARLDLIDRTFESIKGLDRGVVHLCLATACLWREVVFGMSRTELRDFALESAEHVIRTADGRHPGLRFEFSPETFNVTEPEFALEVCNKVASTWSVSPDRPVTLNLPSTVETHYPNVYADQIEWMHHNLDNRDSVILSVHPHNDRGTAVASAELALMAGADRVEGTLFGNGERTGNVCLATLALNLFSMGVEPQLDFSDIDEIRRVVEACNQMPVHARHPYVGELVYTAFSGTHQDAIAKGLAALEERSRACGEPASSRRWQVPYLPIDPGDVGRTYESVIRVNSQSGKGGVAHILESHYGIIMPRQVKIEFAKVIQTATEAAGTELTSRQLWDRFKVEYCSENGAFQIKEFREERTGDQVRLAISLIRPDGSDILIQGAGRTAADALLASLARFEHSVQLLEVAEHVLNSPASGRFACYAKICCDGTSAWGVGLSESPAQAAARAVISGVNRSLAQ